MSSLSSKHKNTKILVAMQLKSDLQLLYMIYLNQFHLFFSCKYW